MEPWDNDFGTPEDPWNTDGPGDSFDPVQKESEIFNSIQHSRMIGDIFGESSGRGILGGALADGQLAHDIASGMSVRDALEQQRLVDYTIGDRRSNGILSDMLTDDLIAQDVENGMDIGEAIAREEFWSNAFDDLFNGE